MSPLPNAAGRPSLAATAPHQLGVAPSHLQGIDAEIIATVHARDAPMIPAATALGRRYASNAPPA
ncbi:MAG: hypothetical protein ICV69_03560 [Thermoleophilaceae bacterium]|nr:hypothetical protein [Thermoleophilaceae bacterium]